MAAYLRRFRRPVSFLVSRRASNQETKPVLDWEVGVLLKDQPKATKTTFSARRSPFEAASVFLPFPFPIHPH